MHFVLPDFYYIARQLIPTHVQEDPECNILAPP
jgi:hypothetical protein